MSNLLLLDSNIQNLLNSVLTIVMPIIIGVAIVSAIIMVAYYAIAGKFAADAQNRHETIKKIVWVLVCLGIVVIASSLVLGFKDAIVNIN